MKTNIKDMSEAEVLALGKKEIDYLIGYAMAEEGIKFLPVPIAPEPFTPEYDRVVYEVAGIYYTNEPAAKDVCEILNGLIEETCTLDYNWQQSSQYKYVAESRWKDSPPTVTAVKCFSNEKYRTLAAGMIQRETEKNQYKKLLEEFQKNESLKQAIVQEIHNVIDEHKSRAYTRNRMISEYERYKEIAQGNVEIAQNFFKKAYPSANFEEVFS